jgi:hypothetical protein
VMWLVLRDYSAFGLALRAAVANLSSVQRGQTSALVGAVIATGMWIIRRIRASPLALLGAALKCVWRR